MRWIAGLIFSIGFILSCARSNGENMSRLENADVLAPATDCADESFCTREYRPMICSFNGQEFSGSNNCEARKLVRQFACEKRLVLDESALSCEPTQKDQGVAVSGIEAECAEKSSKPCTREHIPSRCHVADLSASGNNPCEALRNLKLEACKKRMALSEAAVQCEKI